MFSIFNSDFKLAGRPSTDCPTINRLFFTKTFIDLRHPHATSTTHSRSISNVLYKGLCFFNYYIPVVVMYTIRLGIIQTKTYCRISE